MLVTSLLFAALQLSPEISRNPMCEANPCREPRDFTLQVDGQTIATPYPVMDSPYLVDNAVAILLRDEALVLQHRPATGLDGHSRPTFDAASFTISNNIPDQSTGEIGELKISLTLDDETETSVFQITNYTGHRVAYGVSIVDAAGQPFDVVTCPTDHRDRWRFDLQGQIFTVLVTEIQFVDATAACADYSINEYPLLDQD
jgi:hypothetical protein